MTLYRTCCGDLFYGGYLIHLLTRNNASYLLRRMRCSPRCNPLPSGRWGKCLSLFEREGRKRRSTGDAIDMGNGRFRPCVYNFTSTVSLGGLLSPPFRSFDVHSGSAYVTSFRVKESARFLCDILPMKLDACEARIGLKRQISV